MKVLSVDIGTSALKAALISKDGVEYFQSIFYEKYYSIDFKKGFNLKIWQESFKDILLAFKDFKIDAIVVSGNGPSLITLDENLEPQEVLHWMDFKRDETYKGPSYYLPKVLWTVRNNKYSQISYFVSCAEYFIFLLTGKLFTILPSPSYEPYIWSFKEIESYNLSLNKFPPFIAMGEYVGELNASAKRQFNFSNSAKVITGGLDYITNILGSGGVSEKLLINRTGTSDGINYISFENVKVKNFQTLPYIFKNSYTIGGMIPSSGFLLNFWKRQFFKNSNLSLDDLLVDIEDFKNNDSYFYPNRKLFNSFLENEGYFIGDRTNKRSFGRAVVESLMFNIFSLLLNLRASNLDISKIILTGGYSKNMALNEIKANVLGSDLQVLKFHHTELIGNAILAFLKLDEFNSFKDASDKLVSIENTIKFDKLKHEYYKLKYEKYIENYYKNFNEQFL